MRTERAQVVAVVLSALAVVGLAVSARVRASALNRIDTDLALALNRAVAPHSGVVTFWKVVTTTGGPVVWDVAAAVLAVVLWLRRMFRTASVVVLAVAGAAVLSTVLKVVIARPRPVVPMPVAHAAGMSFPSGHALTSSVAIGVFLMVLLPIVRRRLRGLLVVASVVVVVAIGFSRLVLGVHYLTDVLASWLIAVVWLAAVRTLVIRARRCDRPRSDRAEQPVSRHSATAGRP